VDSTLIGLQPFNSHEYVAFDVRKDPNFSFSQDFSSPKTDLNTFKVDEQCALKKPTISLNDEKQRKISILMNNLYETYVEIFKQMK
jgi:hypothetical protein